MLQKQNRESCARKRAVFSRSMVQWLLANLIHCHLGHERGVGELRSLSTSCHVLKSTFCFGHGVFVKSLETQRKLHFLQPFTVSELLR